MEKEELHKGKSWTCPNVLLAIRDPSTSEQISKAITEIGSNVVSGIYNDEITMEGVVASQVYARILDTHCFRAIADNLREYLAETDDEIPLFFFGNDWMPSYYHRSFICMNGITMTQLKNMLLQAKAYYHSEEHDMRPLLLYPNNMIAYIDVNTDWVTHGQKLKDGQNN